jgi:hypothetical protein
MDRLMGSLKKNGPEKLLERCYPVVPPELGKSAFANAVDIVLASGSVDEDERGFTDDLQKKFEREGTRQSHRQSNGFQKPRLGHPRLNDRSIPNSSDRCNNAMAEST